MKRTVIGGIGVLVLGAAGLVAYALLWPVPGFTPWAWEPPEAPALEGASALNDALMAPQLVATPGSHGPEDLAIDAEGRVVTGVLSGEILRWSSLDEPPEVVLETWGRPLGMDVGPDGSIWIADAKEGLLVLEPDDVLRTAVRKVEGWPLGFADDVEVGPDGIVYFSDASTKYGVETWEAELIENGAYGRLIAYDPADDEVEVLLEGLHFANGVAVAHDGSFVLVVETSRYRVRRYWLTGDKAGDDDIFVDNLPGFPDGISRGKEGFWLALPSPRNGWIDWLGPWPNGRAMIVRLPWLAPKPKRHTMVVGLHPDGTIREVLHGKDGPFSMITSVQEHDGWLYLGSLAEASWARVPVPTAR